MGDKDLYTYQNLGQLKSTKKDTSGIGTESVKIPAFLRNAPASPLRLPTSKTSAPSNIYFDSRETLPESILSTTTCRDDHAKVARASHSEVSFTESEPVLTGAQKPNSDTRITRVFAEV